MCGHDLSANTENSKMSQRRTTEVNNISQWTQTGNKNKKIRIEAKAFQSIVKGA